MKKTKKLVFATNNKHKLEEARRIISDHIEIMSLSDIGCHDDIPETADTLEGNALIKARWVKERYGYDCFADDTGLMVNALDGAPGVYSARYAGEGCSPKDNVEKLLSRLEGVENRDAHFSTVVALIADGVEHTFEGRVDGYISAAPHGNGGFGYDPVFIEKESGRCFAEMAPEEKNAVSHRGRAMRKLCDFLGIILVAIVSMFTPFAASAEQWRMHPTFDGEILRIADTKNFTYIFGTKQRYNPDNALASVLHGNLFRYDKEADELMNLTSSNLLSGNTLKAVAYNYGKNYLAVAYDDGAIDFLYDNGSVKTLRGLMAADPSIDKIVNDFTFDSETGKVYAATNFGFIILNDKNYEIDTSRILGIKVNSAAYYDGMIWLATNDGIYYGEPTGFSLSDYKKIWGGNKISSFFPVGDQLYCSVSYYSRYRCYRIVVNNGVADPVLVSGMEEGTIQRGENCLVSVKDTRLTHIDAKGSVTRYNLPEEYSSTMIGSRDGQSFWVSLGRQGISYLKVPGADGKWTILKDKCFPNASSAFHCLAIEYHPAYGMLVRNHGRETPFSDALSGIRDLISGYKDMTWSRLSTTYRTDNVGLHINDPFGIAVDPVYTDHVYCGSTLSGLLRLDLKNPDKSIHFSHTKDYLNGYGKPGFAVVVPDNPAGTWEQQSVFAAPSFDNNGTLWTAYVHPVPNGEVSDVTELWAWPKEARGATTDASNVQGFKKIRIDNMRSTNWPIVNALKHSSNKNIIVHGGNTDVGLLIYDHAGTIDNRSDDRMATMKVIYDQDGNSVNFYRAFCIFEDSQTGLVWVSTGTGLFTFNPSEVFANPTSVRRIKVPRNDGTNFADYLLEGVQVNNITSDPSGRKWFGTAGAGLICTSADGREVLATYMRDNSEIPGDNVYGICYNPDNGSMMVSTDNGLCELFLDGSSQGSGSDVKIYPNPVRPDYFGYVYIEGLPQDAMVKIVDTAGNLVKECGAAFNGSLEWDVTNIFSKRVPGGVYFVVATNGQDSDSYNKVGKILVVN